MKHNLLLLTTIIQIHKLSLFLYYYIKGDLSLHCTDDWVGHMFVLLYLMYSIKLLDIDIFGSTLLSLFFLSNTMQSVQGLSPEFGCFWLVEQ